jgi:hypothetical protein
MRGLRLAVAAALAATVALGVHVDAVVPPQRQCPANDPLCVLVDKVTTGIPAGLDLGITEQDVAAAEGRWPATALDLQHRLGDELPLLSAQWLGTHNSFNTMSNDPASLSNLDSNQQIGLRDQLRLGIRNLELDVSWFPSPSTGGAPTPILCHELESHIGCTIDVPLVDGLREIDAYVRQHPGTVVLLYVENFLDHLEGHDTAAAIFEQVLGDLLYRPPAGRPCPKLPLTLRRADVLAAGKRVMVMSGCGPGGRWAETVFDDEVRSEDGSPTFDGYPACTSSSVEATDYGTSLVRFFEDSTFVSAVTGNGPRLSPTEIDAMTRCGVNLFGLDQVVPGDPRLDAAVWSWAPGQPSTTADGTCAVLRVQGLMSAVPCGSDHPRRAACLDPANRAWAFTAEATSYACAAARCAIDHPGSVLGVPRSGAEMQRLVEARAAAGLAGCPLWLAYRSSGGSWQALPSG